MPQYKYKPAKVGLNSFSFFNTIPRAENFLLLSLGLNLATLFVLGMSDSLDEKQAKKGLSAAVILPILAYLIYFKPKQDKAVENYYKEIKGVFDPSENNYIYNNSQNVKAMGGMDAIENACATRIFYR